MPVVTLTLSLPGVTPTGIVGLPDGVPQITLTEGSKGLNTVKSGSPGIWNTLLNTPVVVSQASPNFVPALLIGAARLLTAGVSWFL